MTGTAAGTKNQTQAADVRECRPLAGELLDAAAAERLATALKAVADPARLQILSLLRAQPGAEACVCHLTGPLGLKQPTVSHHLKILLGAGLVSREQRGRWSHFTVNREGLATLAALLA